MPCKQKTEAHRAALDVAVVQLSCWHVSGSAPAWLPPAAASGADAHASSRPQAQPRCRPGAPAADLLAPAPSPGQRHQCMSSTNSESAVATCLPLYGCLKHLLLQVDVRASQFLLTLPVVTSSQGSQGCFQCVRSSTHLCCGGEESILLLQLLHLRLQLSDLRQQPGGLTAATSSSVLCWLGSEALPTRSVRWTAFCPDRETVA